MGVVRSILPASRLHLGHFLVVVAAAKTDFLQLQKHFQTILPLPLPTPTAPPACVHHVDQHVPLPRDHDPWHSGHRGSHNSLVTQWCAASGASRNLRRALRQQVLSTAVTECAKANNAQGSCFQKLSFNVKLKTMWRRARSKSAMTN